MRKLKLFLSMLMLIAFSVGNVWAGEVTISPDQALSDGGVDPITVSCAKGDGTTNPAISSGQLRLYQAASGKTTGNTITFSSESAITSIVFTFANNMTASNGSFSDGSYDSKTSTWTGSATSLTLTVTGTTSGTRIYITNMVVTYSDGGKTLTSIAVSGAPTKTSYYVGDEFDPAGLTVTGTYSDDSQAPISSGITWAYDPSQELALNQTSIGVTATVSEISSPKFNVTGLTVTEAPAADNYEKVTGEPADWSGEYLIVYEDGSDAYVWNGADAVNCYVATTISNDVIAKPEGAATLTIAEEGTGYSLLINGGANDGKYITDNANNAALKFADAAYAATLSYETTWTKILFSQRCIRFNNASNQLRFRYYADNGQQPVQLYKKVGGSVKPAAGLAYAEADLKKLAKLGDAFTAPTLQNPNSLTVSYASNNTDVAEVAANGAVTIKAAGVAVITASFDGNDDYKAGSASYTIGVTTHAGTEADPYVAADAKIAIDAMGTVENAYATGIVSNVVTTTLPQEGYITFYFSADGATTGQQIEAYKCYGLNSAAFEALSDVETGATVVVTGNLKKYNSTYEFDANCHLVSYEAPAVPKTHIANDQANPYTVAQAIAYAADGVTYDLDDYVYVQGVVYDVKSFNNGAMNIFIKDANAENQFELFKCAGINDGNATTPFEALTDVQAGNIVIGYGQLTVFNSMSELKQGNYLVDLQKPATGIELDATAEVEAGSTVNLTATILPSNATGTIVWSVESGDDYASVENGVVTGIAEGEAVIRATVQGTEIYAECTVTVTPEAAPDTRKVANSPATFTAVSGDLTPNDIAFAAYKGGAGNDPYLASGAIRLYQISGTNTFGGFITLTAKAGCTIDQVQITTTNNYATTVAYSVDGNENLLGSESVAKSSDYSTPSGLNVESVNIVNKGTGSSGRLEIASIQVYYTGEPLAIDHYFLGGTYETTFEQNGTFDYTGLEVYASYDAGETITEPVEGFTVEADLSTAGEKKAEVYLNEVKIAEYNITVTAGKEDPALAYTPESATITAGDAWSAPTLNNTFNVSPITYSSDKESVATVDENGVIALAGGFGTAVITASFAGNANYVASEATYTITVNKPAATPTSTVYRKVTATEDITDGQYLIVYEGDATHDAAVFDGSLDNVDQALKAMPVEIVSDEIAGNTDLDAAVFTIDVTAGSLQSASGLYIGRTANSNGMDKSTTEVYENTFAITDGAAVITSSAGPTLRYNYASDQLRFRYFKSGQQAIQLYKKVVVTPDPVDPVYTEVRTGLNNGQFYTMCLDKNVTAVDGASIWQIIGKSGNSIELGEVSGELEAGKPYFFKAEAATLKVVYGDEEATIAGTNNGLVGSFTEENITAGEHNYILYDNKLYEVAAGQSAKVGANRAYVDFDAIGAVVGQSPAMRRMAMPIVRSTATGIEAIEVGAELKKVVIDGQLYIVRDGRMYDVTGQLVR